LVLARGAALRNLLSNRSHGLRHTSFEKLSANSKPFGVKGTVSPDIVFYFRVYKFKSVLFVRPLMVFKFVYFVVL
jgi:hypothetical protein